MSIWIRSHASTWYAYNPRPQYETDRSNLKRMAGRSRHLSNPTVWAAGSEVPEQLAPVMCPPSTRSRSEYAMRGRVGGGPATPLRACLRAWALPSPPCFPLANAARSLAALLASDGVRARPCRRPIALGPAVGHSRVRGDVPDDKMIRGTAVVAWGPEESRGQSRRRTVAQAAAGDPPHCSLRRALGSASNARRRVRVPGLGAQRAGVGES